MGFQCFFFFLWQISIVSHCRLPLVSTWMWTIRVGFCATQSQWCPPSPPEISGTDVIIFWITCGITALHTVLQKSSALSMLGALVKVLEFPQKLEFWICREDTKKVRIVLCLHWPICYELLIILIFIPPWIRYKAHDMKSWLKEKLRACALSCIHYIHALQS